VGPREELVREVFAAVTEGRARDVAALVHPDMELVSVVAGKSFSGVDGLQAWYEDVSGYYDDTGWDIIEIRDVGDRDVVRWRFSGRARESEIDFDIEMSQLWSHRDGRVARVEVFPNAEGALLAAGGDAPP
jgi:ketosteroid isomerase-like protein